jgi:hypothetical protein
MNTEFAKSTYGGENVAVPTNVANNWGYNTPMMNTGMMAGYGMPPQFNQTQVVNDQTLKINPQVMTLINPIIETMTQYDMFKKTSPAFGMWDPKNSLNDFEKKRFDETKKQCVHLIRDIQSGQLMPTLEEVDESRFKCRLCERMVYKKFDQTAVDRLNAAIEVLNMLAFFGPTLNITPEHMSKVIFLKQTMHDAIQLVDILNKFVKEEDSHISSAANIGEASRNAEFRVGGMLGFGY